ncbi:MAG: hypothetical protein LKK13_02440 [Bacilli bacterium]|jgi:hypothetical protein|nr:hypothetical protein [Bacilli bacterium]
MRRRLWKTFLCASLLPSLLFACQGNAGSSSAASASSSASTSSSVSSDTGESSESGDPSVDGSFSFFRKQSLLSKEIYVLDVSSLSEDERIFASSLQGLLIAKGQGCYLQNETDAAFETLSSSYELTRFLSFRSFVKQAVGSLQATHYVPLASFSLSASFSAQRQEPLVPDSQVDLASATGLLPDTLTQDYASLFEDAGDSRLLIEDGSPLSYLDFGIAQGAVFLNDRGDYQGSEPYVCSLGDEASIGYQMDMPTKANLSFYGALPKNRPSIQTKAIVEGKHLLSVVCEDALSTSLLGETHAVSPILQAEFPTLLFYRFGGLDSFLNMVEGSPKSIDSGRAAIMNQAIAGSLSRFAYIDGTEKNCLETYAYMGSLDGGVLAADDGVLRFLNHKPFLSYTGVLEPDNAYSLACALNESSKDLTAAGAYSIVRVKSGTSLATLKKFYSALSPEVEIVSAPVLLSALRERVAHADAQNVLPSGASTDSIGPEYGLYDMFSFKYDAPNYAATYSFGSGYGGFSAHSYQADDSIVNQDGFLVISDHGQSSSISNSLSLKIRLPSLSRYLNYQIRSAKGSSFRVRAYDVSADEWDVLDYGRYANLCFQTVSVDLTAVYGDSLPEVICLVFEQMGTQHSDQTVYLDNVSFTVASARDVAFSDNPVVLSAGSALSLADGDWHHAGAVSFNGAAIEFSSAAENAQNKAAAVAWKKVTIGSSEGKYAQLNLDYACEGSAQFRIRTIDEGDYINDAILPWTTLSGAGTLHLDLSSKEDSTVLLYLEFDRLVGQAQSCRVTGLSFDYLPGHYCYPTNATDSFSGTNEEWNLSGWKRGGDATYGDLTADGGYGSLRMDGSNGGHFDPNLAICSWSKWYSLAASCQETLTFSIRSGGPTNATYYRVRAENEAGASFNVSSDENSGWLLVSGEPWNLMSFDLSSFSGQKIRLVFEQTDHGTGVGEICFIDSIAVAEASL